jgi:hypothetical protein
MILSFLKNKIYFNKKNLNLFFFFWLISIVYLFYNIKKNYNQLSNEVIIDFKHFFLAFALCLILINLINYRVFFVFKKLTKYTENYSKWSYLFFKTAVMNFFFWGSGHALRAIELKKKNVNYKEFISVNYLLFFLVFFFNTVFYFILHFFFIKDKNILLYFFILFLSLFILLRKEFYFLIFHFILTKLTFFKKKIKFIYKFFFFFNNFSFLSKKNTVVFFFFKFINFFF